MGYYEEQLKGVRGVNVTHYSPLDVGQRPETSAWREVAGVLDDPFDGLMIVTVAIADSITEGFKRVKDMPRAERVQFIIWLAGLGYRVQVRPATHGGSFRIWIAWGP